MKKGSNGIKAEKREEKREIKRIQIDTFRLNYVRFLIENSKF